MLTVLPAVRYNRQNKISPLDVKQGVIMDDNERMNEGIVEQQGNNEEKTFTQDEVNEIVRRRLARERMKNGSEEYSGTDRERSLEERELHLMAREKLFNEGLPSQLADILKYSDEKSLDAALTVIKKLNIESEAPKAKSWGQRHSGGGNQFTEATKIREAMGLNHK